MFDEDQDTLAAEYVLGTLSAEEREHVEALLSFDPGFEAAVRQWERRLGELNVMVEAVEPPAEVWDKIRNEVSPEQPPVETLPRALDAPSAAESGLPRDLDAPASATEWAADFATVEVETEQVSPTATGADTPVATPRPAPAAGKVERSADVIYLASRVRRWRGATLGLGAIAALLAIYLGVSRFAPDLIPPQLRTGAWMMARSDGAGRSQDRLVAVLQQQPTAPAFLLTLDTQHRTLTVRRVAATPEGNRSYELWLIPNRSTLPRSLGVVGGDEFTQRAFPGNVDVDTLRTATFAVSLEPAGGSPSGAPTGPVLFTGKPIESLPSSPPPQQPDET